MKRMLVTIAVVISLVAVTGCGSKKTLTCTKSSTDAGFVNEEKAVFEFENDRIKTATETISVTAEGENAEYIDSYYKNDSAQAIVEKYKNVKGIEASVESDNNKITVTIKRTPAEMSEETYEQEAMGENYDSTKAIFTEKGYTCK